ncbi:MAG: hypothetical protein PHQ23_03495 [Candidatus Wallbacteria bacterium]|nr:hypothetical protein [Candidatus Wallbacteria bacterium]
MNSRKPVLLGLLVLVCGVMVLLSACVGGGGSYGGGFLIPTGTGSVVISAPAGDAFASPMKAVILKSDVSVTRIEGTFTTGGVTAEAGLLKLSGYSEGDYIVAAKDKFKVKVKFIKDKTIIVNIDTVEIASKKTTVSVYEPKTGTSDYITCTYLCEAVNFDSTSEITVNLKDTLGTPITLLQNVITAEVVETALPAAVKSVVAVVYPKPANVSSFGTTEVELNQPKVCLSWVNPLANFEQVLILRKENTAPASVTDGIAVYDGSAASFDDLPATGVSNSKTYVYRAWAYNTTGGGTNYASSEVTLAVTVGADNQAPAVPASFLASFNPVDSSIDLSWTNPSAVDFAGVVLLRSASPVSGVSDGNASTLYAGTATSYKDSGVIVNNKYYYAVYAKDEVPNYSAADTAELTASKTLSSIAVNPIAILVYTADGTYNLTAIKIIATYEDNSTAEVTGGAWSVKSGSGSVNGSTFTIPVAPGSTVLTCTYNEKTADLTVTVNKSLSSISLTPSAISVITADNTYDLSQLAVIATYDDASTAEVTNVTWSIKSGSGSLNGSTFTIPTSSGSTVLTCTYSGKTADLTVTIQNFTPLAATSFTALQWKHDTNGFGEIDLYCHTPNDDLVTGVKILRKTTGYPSSNSDGDIVFEGAVSKDTEKICEDTGLTDGTAYYYAVYVYHDEGGTKYYSNALTSQTTPGDFPLVEGVNQPLPAQFAGTIKIGSADAPVGTKVRAYDPDGVICGTFAVTNEGTYTFGVAGDAAGGTDSGAESGVTITFYINGYAATVSGTATWEAGAQSFTTNLSY